MHFLVSSYFQGPLWGFSGTHDHGHKFRDCLGLCLKTWWYNCLEALLNQFPYRLSIDWFLSWQTYGPHFTCSFASLFCRSDEDLLHVFIISCSMTWYIPLSDKHCQEPHKKDPYWCNNHVSTTCFVLFGFSCVPSIWSVRTHLFSYRLGE